MRRTVVNGSSDRQKFSLIGDVGTSVYVYRDFHVLFRLKDSLSKISLVRLLDKVLFTNTSSFQKFEQSLVPSPSSISVFPSSNGRSSVISKDPDPTGPSMLDKFPLSKTDRGPITSSRSYTRGITV